MTDNKHYTGKLKIGMRITLISDGGHEHKGTVRYISSDGQNAGIERDDRKTGASINYDGYGLLWKIRFSSYWRGNIYSGYLTVDEKSLSWKERMGC